MIGNYKGQQRYNVRTYTVTKLNDATLRWNCIQQRYLQQQKTGKTGSRNQKINCR